MHIRAIHGREEEHGLQVGVTIAEPSESALGRPGFGSPLHILEVEYAYAQVLNFLRRGLNSVDVDERQHMSENYGCLPAFISLEFSVAN